MSKVSFMVMQAGSRDLADCATVLLHALTANAMDAQVEMYFIGPSVRLLRDQHAESVVVSESGKTLGMMLDDAHDNGIKIFVCTSAWKAHVPSDSSLAKQCSGFAGAATYLGRALDPSWRVLTY